MTVFLVANRGPGPLRSEAGRTMTDRGAGGLVGLLDDVARDIGGRSLWVATAPTGAGPSGPEVRSVGGHAVAVVPVEAERYTTYYAVSNRLLWFAHHRLLDELGLAPFGAGAVRNWRSAYEAVNQAFARRIAGLARFDDVVMVQDYHLARVPHLLRVAGFGGPIAHFTHTPFCEPNVLERLPAPIPQELLEGLLGADLLGFHIRRWTDAFLACCEWAGYQVDRAKGLVRHGEARPGGQTWVREYPAPVDAGALRREAASRGEAWARRLAPPSGHRLIVRVDRADPSKNLVRGFLAFGLLLDRRPDLRDSVRFVASLHPSRESMPEYRRYRRLVAASINDVNGRHPGAVEVSWGGSRGRILGALRIYDVLLVNPIMDGMNVVAKEGPAVNERSGVLILSSGAGSSVELGRAALVVDPLDVAGTAEALERALDMTMHERRVRAESLRAEVTSRSPRDWIPPQIKDLRTAADGGEPPRSDAAW